jgi:AraC-like DNA-binding protein
LKNALALISKAAPTVMAAAAQGALERIAASGVDPAEVLAETGLDASDFIDPTHRINLSNYCRFFEVAAFKTTRSNFGLEFGASFQPQQLGMLGYVAISAPTLGMALRKFATYLPTHQQATRLAIGSAADGTAAIEYAILDGAIRYRQQDAELSVAMLINIFRHSLGPHWSPIAVHFMHPRPQGKTHYEDLFGVPPRFEQTSNRIVFRRMELESAMPRRDDNLLRLLEFELQKRLAHTDATTDILERTRYEIGIALAKGNVDLEQISKQCGLPPWTVKRRLKQQGLTFQQLVSETRYKMAMDYLNRAMSITDVAFALGYSEVSAFSRAFRDWTGSSPKKFLAFRGIRLT